MKSSFILFAFYFGVVFVITKMYPPPTPNCSQSSWNKVEEGKEGSTVELLNYAAIIQLTVVIWPKVEMSASFCLFSQLYVVSLVTGTSTLYDCVSASVCVCACVHTHMCTVNSLSCQIPLGGVRTDCVFHLVKVFRLQIPRVGRSWNDLLKSWKRLTFDNFWCGSWVWFTAPGSQPPFPVWVLRHLVFRSHSRDTEKKKSMLCFFCVYAESLL